jgi:predicted  nucleic acid-binding Zn-ribbon protein
MIDLRPSLSLLQEKLQLLLKRLASLEKEHQQLQAQVAKKEEQVQDLQQKLLEEQSKLAAAMMNHSEMNPAEKEKMVHKIDQYIKEIDTAIKNLNP